MIRVRRAADRGHFDHGWLRTWHTFSFGGYHDPAHMGFSDLRVINEDRVAPGRGFAPHGHRDMEIVTVVLAGEVTHADSMGNRTVIRAGDVQRMSAGSGVQHSEHNASPDEELHLYQIWLFPRVDGTEPSYEQRSFPAAAKSGRLRLLVSAEGRDDSLRIDQDVDLHGALLSPGQSLRHEFAARRAGWLQVVRGACTLAGGETLAAGDGAALIFERGAPGALELRADEASEFLLFDLVDRRP